MLAQPLGQAGHGGNLSGSGVHLASVPGQLDTAPPLSGQRISIPLPGGSHEASADRRFSFLREQLYTQVSLWTMGQCALPGDTIG